MKAIHTSEMSVYSNGIFSRQHSSEMSAYFRLRGAIFQKPYHLLKLESYYSAHISNPIQLLIGPINYNSVSKVTGCGRTTRVRFPPVQGFPLRRVQTASGDSPAAGICSGGKAARARSRSLSPNNAEIKCARMFTSNFPASLYGGETSYFLI